MFFYSFFVNNISCHSRYGSRWTVRLPFLHFSSVETQRDERGFIAPAPATLSAQSRLSVPRHFQRHRTQPSGLLAALNAKRHLVAGHIAATTTTTLKRQKRFLLAWQKTKKKMSSPSRVFSKNARVEKRWINTIAEQKLKTVRRKQNARPINR